MISEIPVITGITGMFLQRALIESISLDPSDVCAVVHCQHRLLDHTVLADFNF